MKTILTTLALAAVGLAQQAQTVRTQESVATQVGRGRPIVEGTATPTHPFEVVVRSPKAGCDNTAVCGEEKYRYVGHNLRTSAGTTWQFNQMAGTTAAVGTYMALTNTAITPAFADTTLSGEIVANGLTRGAADTVTNGSTTLAVPSAPTLTKVGTHGGAAAYYYFVAACNQGVCGTPSAASTQVTGVADTLTTANHVAVAFSAVAGASSYQVYRSTSSTVPSGAVSGTTGLISGTAACTSAGSCVALDQSNTLTAVTVGSTANTNYGKYVLVKTWTCTTASQSAQAFGIFNASSSGTLIFEGTFTQVNLNVGDTFQLSHTVYY